MTTMSAGNHTSNPPEVPTALFERAGDTYIPLPVAHSPWKPGRLNGVAITGLLAHSAEDALLDAGDGDFVPARFNAIMYRSAVDTPTTVRSRVLQASHRVVVIESDFCQDRETIARATTLALQPSRSPLGKVWAPTEEPPTPPPAGITRLVDSPMMPTFNSDQPWSDDFSHHQNAGRHALWQQPVFVVQGSEPRPFEALASMADLANMVTNWGDRGIGHINTDVSLALARRPRGSSFGMRATDRIEQDGVAVCSAEVFDEEGRCGIVTISAIANAAGGLNYSEV